MAGNGPTDPLVAALPMLRNRASWLCRGDLGRAQDLVGETCLRVLESPPNDPSKLLEYARIVMLNAFRDEHRRRKRALAAHELLQAYGLPCRMSGTDKSTWAGRRRGVARKIAREYWARTGRKTRAARLADPAALAAHREVNRRAAAAYRARKAAA